MIDLLERVFGPDLNPNGDLPTLPGHGFRGDCTHRWCEGFRFGVPYRLCLACGVEISDLP